MSNEIFGSIVETLATVSAVGAVGCLIAASFAPTGKRRPKLMGAVICAALFLAVLGGSYAYTYGVVLPELARKSQDARRSREDEAVKVRVGQQAPFFRIGTLSGTDFDLSEQRGKVVLLNFYATWCGPCMQELPHIEDLWKEHRSNSGFAMLVIDREEPVATASAFVKKRGFSFPVAADPKREVYSLYAKEFIPRTFLISSEGQIVYSSNGFHEEDIPKLRAQVEQQLARQ
jgi:peroxiredoxin